MPSGVVPVISSNLLLAQLHCPSMSRPTASMGPGGPQTLLIRRSFGLCFQLLKQQASLLVVFITIQALSQLPAAIEPRLGGQDLNSALLKLGLLFHASNPAVGSLDYYKRDKL